MNSIDLDRYLKLVSELKSITEKLNKDNIFIKDGKEVVGNYNGTRTSVDRLCMAIRDNYTENKFILASSRCYPFFEVKQ